MITKEAVKILKYTDLKTEIHRMQVVKTKVIPAVIGATLNISKTFIKYMASMT